jgi:tetratricopeptide (TPR) repeat protein
MKIASSIAVLAVMFSGCAGVQTRNSEPEAMRGNKEAASKLYAGQPAVVHATEFPVTSAADGIQRGDAAWRQGSLDLAVYLYVQSLAYDATAAGPFLKIGAIHEKLGNRELAAKAFELALERDADNAAVCERLGLLYLESQRNEEAQALFERAISRDPARWQSHNGLGIAADRRTSFASAIAHYNAALVLVPGMAKVVNNRGYSRYLDGDLMGAEADFREATRLGAQAGTWTNLGRVLARQGRYPEALESFLKEADMAHANNLLGEMAMENLDYDAAQKYFTSAIADSPRYFDAAQVNLALANERLANPGVPERLTNPGVPATQVARSDAIGYGVYWGPSVNRRGQVRPACADAVSGQAACRRSRGADSTGLDGKSRKRRSP